jgi:hypothetical protein
MKISESCVTRIEPIENERLRIPRKLEVGDRYKMSKFNFTS